MQWIIFWKDQQTTHRRLKLPSALYAYATDQTIPSDNLIAKNDSTRADFELLLKNTVHLLLPQMAVAHTEIHREMV